MLDANVLVAGTIWPRFPGQVLNHAVLGDFRLVLTEYVLEEARRHITRLRPDKLANFEGVLERVNFEIVEEPGQAEIDENSHLVRDLNDVPIVLAAINAKVDFFVSQDKDITDPTQPVHEKLKIILPGTFLREHMGWTSEELEQVRDAK
jgi:putative PIN family toxin of toxin-antitoxin system